MASLNAAINEFARRPPQFKIAVFGGLAVVMGLLYWQFLLSPLNVKRDEARSAITALEGERDRLTAQEKEYRELLDKRERLERVTKTIERVLPTDAELPAFFEMLDRRFSEAGVEARKVARKPEVSVDAFIKVPVEIEITGTYLQIKRFFASLVAGKPMGEGDVADATEAALEQDRIITVQDFSLKRAASDKRADGSELLVAKFTAATFRQEGSIAPASAPPAAAKPAAPAAGAAKPATPAAGAPKNPVGKAKADTGKAMDASQSRAAGQPAAAPGKAGN